MTLLIPARALLACLLQDELADRKDEPRRLGDRDEHDRRDLTPGRVAPAQQRLGTTDAVADQTDDRLKLQGQLTAVESTTQIGFEGKPVADLGAEFAGKRDGS